MKGWVIPVMMAVGLGYVSKAVEGQTVLDNYIKRGLDSNLALRQKDFNLQQARLDLQRARSLFFPRADFASQYTLASGGRSIDIPVGDLLNDVYTTLNQLTASGKFPQLANQSVQFLPNNFHDTRVELALPVYNRQLGYNREIQEERIRTRQLEIDAYKRDLVKNIKVAYYQYLQADKAVNIYTNALQLANENLRVAEKLVQNDMATREVTFRAKSQVSQVQTLLIEARNNRQNAAAYFNFLLNEPLTNAVETDSSLLEQVQLPESIATETPDRREELAQLKSYQSILHTNLKLNRSYFIPVVNAFYQIGFQGYGVKFNNDQFYQLGGLQLQWPLFRANDNKFKIRQSELELEALGARYKEVEQQLNLQVQTALNNYRSALQLLQSLRDEVQSSAETYRLAERRYREGQALQIELIDARTQLTNAQIQYSLAQLAALTRAAELEYATASYKF
jgi:outer membrane protein